MENRLFMALLGAFCLVGCAQTPQNKVLDYFTNGDQEIALGTIREADGPLHFNVHFINESGDSIVPVDKYIHCRCASVEYDDAPVAPGETHLIRATFDPAYRSGNQMEHFVVQYQNGTVAHIVFTVNVIPMAHPIEEDQPYDMGGGLFTNLQALHFGNNAPGEQRRILLRLANSLTRKMTVHFEPVGDYAEAFQFRDMYLGPDQRDTMTVLFTMPEGIAHSDTVVSSVNVFVNGKMLEKAVNVKFIAE